MTTISTHEAKTHRSRYLAAVEEKGEEIIIMRGQRPVARLVPLDREQRAPRPRVGELLGDPGEIPDEALRALNDEELAAWGL